jgi:predicted restriction endonuclease
MPVFTKEYRKEYMKKYQFYTYQSQERFSNESLKTQKILTDLEDIVFKKDLLETHSKFIQESIKTIDNIIWATKTRVELEQISRGK